MTSVLSNLRVIEESPLEESASYFIVLDDMQRIARYSFLVHKSVSYLDLNLREYSSRGCDQSNPKNAEKVLKGLIRKSNFISTQENSKKNLAKNRSVLYSYHLDFTSELESSQTKLEKNFVYDYCGTLLNGIITPSDLYEKRLTQMIMANLLKTQEVKFVKRILEVMKIVNLSINLLPLLNRCLEVLFSQGANFDVIKQFSSTVKIKESDLLFLKPQTLGFFLRHSDYKDCRDREFQRRQEWIHFCISTYKFDHVAMLLKYYKAPKFSEYAYDKTTNSLGIASALTVAEMERPVKLGWISKERNLLVLQTLDIFYSSAMPFFDNSRFQTMGLEALKLVWSSIPDILISQEELELLFRDTKIRRDIRRIRKFHKLIFVEKIDVPKPRKLMDYCRIVIRNILCENQQLPEGINQLGLPTLIQSFLKLEITWMK